MKARASEAKKPKMNFNEKMTKESVGESFGMFCTSQCCKIKASKISTKSINIFIVLILLTQ